MEPVRIKMSRVDQEPGQFKMRIDWVDDTGKACTVFAKGTAAELKVKRDEILSQMHDSKR